MHFEGGRVGVGIASAPLSVGAAEREGNSEGTTFCGLLVRYIAGELGAFD